MRHIHPLFHTLILIMLAAAATIQSAAPTDDTLQVELNTDDGPHVFWQDNTTAVVFYFCDGEVVSRTIVVNDTLRFNGFCGDTATEYTVSATAEPLGPFEFDDVSRVFAISDMHGDYDHTVEIFINAGVIDSALHWTFGDGHLVVNGDVFDRGDRVTECLWLIYRLEQEARAAGGAVHFILGNHELMALRGDLRYVHKRYMTGIARRRFKYDELFGPRMELGRWLRRMHTVVRINDILFVHGGLIPSLMHGGFDAARINDRVRTGLDYSSPRLYFDDTTKLLYGGKGPLWYRGFHYEMEGRYPAATGAQIDSLLDFYGAARMVVGHTEQDSIVVIHDGRVIAIDVPVEDIGGQQALLWQDGRFYVVTAAGELKVLE